MDNHLNSFSYVPPLDGLRAIAVTLVMLTHANFQIGENGILGVDIFFALSGFLITTLLLQEYSQNGRISIGAFYVRRAFRLFPALYTMLTAVVVYNVLMADPNLRNAVFLEVLSSALYLNNISWYWGWGAEGLLLGHTWSLAVEEQFYLTWPWIVMLVARQSVARVAALLFAIIVVLSFLAKLLDATHPLINSIFHEPLLIGCIAAILRAEFKISQIPALVTVAFVLLLTCIGLLPGSWYLTAFEKGGRILVAVITAVIILGVAENKIGSHWKLLSNPALVYTGKISYALYLWHVPVFKFFKWHSTFPPSISFLMKFIVTFALASLSWFLIERFATKAGRIISARLMLARQGA